MTNNKIDSIINENLCNIDELNNIIIGTLNTQETKIDNINNKTSYNKKILTNIYENLYNMCSNISYLFYPYNKVNNNLEDNLEDNLENNINDIYYKDNENSSIIIKIKESSINIGKIIDNQNTKLEITNQNQDTNKSYLTKNFRYIKDLLNYY